MPTPGSPSSCPAAVPTARVCTGRRDTAVRHRLFAALRQRPRLGRRRPPGLPRTPARAPAPPLQALTSPTAAQRALALVRAELRRVGGARHRPLQALKPSTALPRMSLLSLLSSLVKPGPRVEAAAYAARLREGQALLVDIREPAEWARGVAESAALLPLSDLRGERRLWAPFLAAAAGKEILLYCASGMRSSTAAQLLQSEGVRAVNAGALGDWAAAGWLIVPPKRA